MLRVALLNAVANDPSVLSAVAPLYTEVDLAAFFANPGNVMFGDRDGLVIFGCLGHGEYELHYLFTDRRRGAALLGQVRDAISELFTYHDATAICGLTPRENRAARMVNRALGARPVGVSTDSLGRACILYRLDRASWATFLAESSAASAP